MPRASTKPTTPARPAKLYARAVGLVLGLLLGVCLSYMRPAEAARNGSGTYSLASGNPVVTGTTITSTWANATLSDIGTEITSSLDRSGRGAMLAALQCYSGTVSAPGITFSAETNSGLYRIGSHDFGLSVNGTKREEWTATQNVITADTLVTATTANGTGVTATGLGTGAGLLAYGGDTAGSGWSGASVVGYSGDLATVGAFFYGPQGTPGGSNSSYTLKAEAATNYGGQGAYILAGSVTDGGAGGLGARVEGGAGDYGGAGVYAIGGAGTTEPAAGLVAQAGATSTGSTRTTAISCNNGDIWMDSVAEVTSTTEIKNRLTPSNLVKAWAKVATNGSGACTVTEGFNVASCAVSGNGINISVAQDFADANAACTASIGGTWQYSCNCYTSAAGTAHILCGDMSINSERSLATNAHSVSFIAIGKQ